MLVDDAVVVLENVECHLELYANIQEAIFKRIKEVVGPVFAGTIATIAVIVPLMFVGDYLQHIFRPLILTLIISLLVSYFLLVTFISRLSFEEAIESVRMWFWPVMMTAFGTIAGMIPMAWKQAVGLECFSPVTDVAIGGLLVGTLLTLIYVLLYAYATDPDNKKAIL